MRRSKFIPKNSVPNRRLERVHVLANKYVTNKIATILDRLENALADDDGKVAYDRQKLEKSLGEELALAYALGSLDKTDNAGIIYDANGN